MPGNIINLNAADIAKWPTPNYDNPYQRRSMPVYAGMLFGIATIMVMLRLWLRAMKYAGGLGIDDVLLTCCWFCLAWFTALAIIDSEVFYISRHLWDIPFQNFAPIAKLAWMGELSFLFAGCFVKISVLLFYRRIVEITCSKYWIWAVLAAIGFTIAYTLAFMLALVFNCTPTEAYWKAFDFSWNKDYHCANTQPINLLAGIVAVVSDLCAVALPCIMLRKLILPRRHKIALNFVFSLGLIVVAASGVRTYYLWKIGHSVDVSTAIWKLFFWAQLELSLGVMCACAPSLRVLFRQYLSDPFSKIKRSVTFDRALHGPGFERVQIDHLEHPHEQFRHDSCVNQSTICPPSKIHQTEGIAAAAHAATIPFQEGNVPPKVWQPGKPGLVKTPADYESYNLQTVQKSAQLYRQSQQSSERTRRYSDRFRHYRERSQSYGRLESEELTVLPSCS